MKINKIIYTITLSALLILLSCSNNSLGLEGIYVRDVPAKNPDTLFVTHLKDNSYRFEAREWKKGVKKSRHTTGTLDENKIFLDNGKVLELNERGELVIGQTAYKNID